MKRSPPQTLALPPPKGADHWRKLLQPAGLSLLPGTFERVQHSLLRPNNNADQVAQALAQDPAACLHHFLRANRLVQAAGNEIHDLSHLVSLLGFPQVRQLLHSLPIAEEPHPRYWRRLQVSLLRTHLLSLLPLAAAGLQASELHFAVQFSDLPAWLCWHFAADEQDWLDGLARNPKIGPAKAQQLVFGTDLRPLLRQQLTHLPLPQLLKQRLALPADQLQGQLCALARAHRHNRVTQIKNRRLLVVVLVECVAERLCHAPSHSGARLAQQLLAQLLQSSEARISQACHRALGELPLLHPLLLETHPARRLLCHWPRHATAPTYSLPRPQNANRAPVVGSSPDATRNAAIQSAPTRLLDNRFVNADTVRDSLTALRQGAANLASLNNILQCISRTLSQGIGMHQGALFLRDPAGGWQLKYSFDSDSRLPDQVADTTLLTKLAGKPAAVLINDDNRSALSTHLPPSLCAALQSQDILFISLCLKGKCIALLMAAEADLSPPRLQACKLLAQAAQQAIARLAVKVQRRAAGQHN